MFWSGRVSGWSQLLAAWKGKEVSLAESLAPPKLPESPHPECWINLATRDDSAKIANLLNKWFESRSSRAEISVTSDWIRSTFLGRHAIWVVARDPLGTIRGCVASFACAAPYPNSLGGCATAKTTWGLVDWFCVEPLWREKGIGSQMLATLDFITWQIGRRAHIFLKEGLPLGGLSPIQIPIYGSVYWVRRAGSTSVSAMRENSGLNVWPFHAKDKETGLPLIRVEGVRSREEAPEPSQIKDWEDALDTELPPCWVFVTSVDKRDPTRGWTFDSLVWMYAFRWIPGKWLGDPPNVEIV